MLTALWKIGVLSSTAIFGLKAGLALGLSGLSRRLVLPLLLTYAVGLYGLIRLIGPRAGPWQQLAEKYSYAVFLAMAVLIIWAGFHTLRAHQVECCDISHISWLALAAPCPCCYGAVALTVLLAAPLLGVATPRLGLWAAGVLAAVSLLAYLAAGLLVRLTRRPQPVLLGQLMLLVGLYFLALALVMPAVNSLSGLKMSPLYLPPPGTTLLMSSLVLLLGAVGAVRVLRHKYGR
ncbi:MAG: DUF2162 domain-containing protein [Desulfurispora sp.]|uniref:DUF2162 domain-containing protein n=1 Tax=Desulfurispora sp. TaxID=3014275 RepID=UPI00404B8CD7